MSTQTQNASTQTEPSQSQEKKGTGSSGKQNSDYINHYLSGEPIFYIYSVHEYLVEHTGELVYFYKANLKTGLKTGDTYIPVEGTLSEKAVKYLKPIMFMLNSDDPATKRTAGVTVKSPRFEGVNAFITSSDKQKLNAGEMTINNIEPVGVARYRIHTIKNLLLFERKEQPSSTGEETGENAEHNP